MIARAMVAAILCVALTACDRRPQWVLWATVKNTWEAQSEHYTLAACQKAIEDLTASGAPGSQYRDYSRPKCLPTGTKP